ncbi:MAG TPA: DinB family protein [Chloroflexota bacterium]|nr:DinB family protein [Chloroflexota bacterium]
MANRGRTEVPLSGDERAMLNAFLDAQRDTLEWKCSGLAPEQLKEAASPPSPLTLLGLLRHLTEVEYFWLEGILLGKRDHLGLYSGQANPAEGDRAWADVNSHSVDDVKQNWKEACEASRRNAASLPSLDAAAALHWDNEPVTLRWITVHMIREYARHTGHADLLRERIDGATGE